MSQEILQFLQNLFLIEHIATRFVNQTNFRRATVLKLKLPECNEVCILVQLINAFDQNQYLCETCSRCGHM